MHGVHGAAMLRSISYVLHVLAHVDSAGPVGILACIASDDAPSSRHAGGRSGQAAGEKVCLLPQWLARDMAQRRALALERHPTLLLYNVGMDAEQLGGCNPAAHHAHGSKAHPDMHDGQGMVNMASFDNTTRQCVVPSCCASAAVDAPVPH